MKKRRLLVRQQILAQDIWSFVDRGFLPVAHGVMGYEFVGMQHQYLGSVVEINCLPACWSDHPEKIVPDFRRELDAVFCAKRNVAVFSCDYGAGDL